MESDLVPRERYEALKKAGHINAACRAFGVKLIKPGVKLLDVVEQIEQKIKEMGGGMAFPVQISLNDVAAHYCPSVCDETVFSDGDIAKLDVGVHIDGHVADGATCVDLGGHEDLAQASRKALDAAIKVVRDGACICDVGRAIQDVAEHFGVKPVRNLCGHGLAQWIVHGPPSIPNYDNGNKTTLHAGQLIAIEPFMSLGAGMIYEEENSEVFMLISSKPVRNMLTRKVHDEIKKFHGLPFTPRWLLSKFPKTQVEYALRDLLKQGLCKSYGPLVDREHGLISQSEHSMIICDGKADVLTVEEE